MYRITHTPSAGDQARAIARKAIELGKKEDLVSAFESAYQALAHDPMSWGEAKFRTKKKSGWICYGFCEAVCVEYVVFEEEMVVIITAIKPLRHSYLG